MKRFEDIVKFALMVNGTHAGRTREGIDEINKALRISRLTSEVLFVREGRLYRSRSPKKGKFEMASGGTLFLDEIGDMGVEVQAKLLRILEGQQFERLGSSKSIQTDLRLIAATNRNLKKMVEEKKFRTDLFFRINVFPIQIPPLREHFDDIPMLCNYFVHNFSQAFGRKTPKLTRSSVAKLKEHNWVGNIRELENVIERAMILCREDQITSRHFILHESPKTHQDNMSIDQIVSFLIGDAVIDIEDLGKRPIRRLG